jgi:hypothetical protein
LKLEPAEELSAELTSSVCAVLSHCSALTDVSFGLVSFGDAATSELIQARWTQILRSLPNVRRVCAPEGGDSILMFLAVLPLHVPLLRHLTLSNLHAESVLPQLAHPSVRHLRLSGPYLKLSDEHVRALLHSLRLPKLERID